MYKPGISLMQRLRHDSRRLQQEILRLSGMICAAGPEPIQNALRELLDRYDIRDAITGRDRSISLPSYERTSAGLLMPPQPMFSIGLDALYSSPLMSYNQAMRIPLRSWSIVAGETETDAERALREAVHEEEERRKAAAEEQRVKAFLNTLNNLSVTPAVLLENPNPPAHAAPDYMETLTGYRCWSVNAGHLESIGMDASWRPRLAEPARCISLGHFRNNCHDTPAPQCECACGYWSFKTMPSLMEAICAATDIPVIGSVEIWGRIIEHENGYRSEFAYPKELWLLKPGLEYLSWAYGVPVRRLDA